jgi:hypothetical protein
VKATKSAVLGGLGHLDHRNDGLFFSADEDGAKTHRGCNKHFLLQVGAVSKSAASKLLWADLMDAALANALTQRKLVNPETTKTQLHGVVGKRFARNQLGQFC